MLFSILFLTVLILKNPYMISVWFIIWTSGGSVSWDIHVASVTWCIRCLQPREGSMLLTFSPSSVSFIQKSRPIVKWNLLSRSPVTTLEACGGNISTHIGLEGWDVLVRNGNEGGMMVVGNGGKGRRGCIFSSECGRRARLVASWPPAPDGCVIDAHPSSRATGASRRVKCDGVGGD